MIFWPAFLGAFSGTCFALLACIGVLYLLGRNKPGVAVGLKVTAGPITSQFRKKV